jgi:hypothetical protein
VEEFKILVRQQQDTLLPEAHDFFFELQAHELSAQSFIRNQKAQNG